MKHPHAGERRRPSIDRQLEGAGLWESPSPDAIVGVDPGSPEGDRTGHGPHRVGRRTLTQDRAHFIAKILASPKRVQVLKWLRERRGRGFTRDQIAQGIPMKLQTVCGRVNELLTFELAPDEPFPLVYENGIVNGSNLVFYHDNADTLIA